ncbi:hypothetical protein LUZ60_012655 [Juncus effusus]|nr:hypothetical protein LUZ60_012655 [Juncus effusus]
MESIRADPDIIRTDGSAHRFIINYSKIKDMDIGQCIISPTFKSEGYQWVINFYPKGNPREDNDGEYSSLFLGLLKSEVLMFLGLNLSIAFGIIKGDGTHGMEMVQRRFNQMFKTSENCCGFPRFIKRSALEERYVTNGFFVVSCTINMKDKVIDKLPVVEDISKLWRSGEMADVKFEVISAHKVILGLRSPVFKAELYGSMSETKMDYIQIKDMKPVVFKALVLFTRVRCLMMLMLMLMLICFSIYLWLLIGMV